LNACAPFFLTGSCCRFCFPQRGNFDVYFHPSWRGAIRDVQADDSFHPRPPLDPLFMRTGDDLISSVQACARPSADDISREAYDFFPRCPAVPPLLEILHGPPWTTLREVGAFSHLKSFPCLDDGLKIFRSQLRSLALRSIALRRLLARSPSQDCFNEIKFASDSELFAFISVFDGICTTLLYIGPL